MKAPIVDPAPGPFAGQAQQGLLSKEALAEFLGVTTRTVEAYQSRGLPFYRLGRRRNRYDLVAVLAWLNRNGRDRIDPR